MTALRLLPRLNSLGMSRINELTSGKPAGLSNITSAFQDYASLISFAASGGTKTVETSSQLARAIKDVAAELGFPQTATPLAKADFDYRVTILLAGNADLRSGEALRDDVWAFVTTILLPDIVIWRFPDAARDRFVGGIRNTFQRLWIRGLVLDRGAEASDRWALVRELTEDAMAQIFERPSISGNRCLAAALAEGWLRCSGAIGRQNMEDIMRKVTKLIRLQNEIRDLSYLPGEELAALIDSVFLQVRAPL